VIRKAVKIEKPSDIVMNFGRFTMPRRLSSDAKYRFWAIFLQCKIVAKIMPKAKSALGSLFCSFMMFSIRQFDFLLFQIRQVDMSEEVISQM
jgi:hypothetical protein